MLSINQAILWLIVIIVLLAIEIATLGLTTIWFAGGAMAAFISTFFGADFQAQLLIFGLLSLVLLIVTRPIAMRYMRREPVKTNADSLVGKVAIVTGRIDNLAQSGEVMIADVSWTARAKDEAGVIAEGRKVRICAIEGVKLIVEEIKEEM